MLYLTLAEWYMAVKQSLFYCVTGCVSELVARWLSFAGLDPRRLVDLSDVEFDNVEQQHTEENAFRKAASLDIKEGCKLEVEQGAEATPANDHESAILG
jgi:hypothetical protein